MYEYARTNGMCRNKRSFAELLGIDNGNLSKALGNDAKYMTDSLLIRVNNALGNVFSFDWLLTGNGEMLNGNTGSNGDSIHHNSGNVATRGAHITTSTDEKDRLIASLQSQITTLQSQIDPHHERGAVGILIAPDHQRKGFGNEALQLMCSYAFGFLHLHQLYAHILQENKNSLKLFSENGFISCGLFKEWVKTENGYKNVVVMQRIN